MSRLQNVLLKSKMQYGWIAYGSAILISSICVAGHAQGPWWSEQVTQRIESSDNREQLFELFQSSEPEIRPAVAFLVLNMPGRDLDSLTAEFLLNDVRLATEIRESAKWKITDELFFNDVLPYANVDETREPWRRRLNSICQPLIAGCNTPAEVAQRLNEKLFGEVNVKYSTKRSRANQSPSESIEQGLASCTGLSILLVDACRSVGVPARLAGIPAWPNKPGNHTWVEIWDGQWHFTGAAEPSSEGLNHAWFESDAALARKDSRLNAIYALSFRGTGTIFPRVWSRDDGDPTYAVNVTDRYTQKTQETSADMVRVFVRVWNSDRSRRIATTVHVATAADNVRQSSGESRGDAADMNDLLSFDLKRKQQYVLQIGSGKPIMNHLFTTADGKQQTLEIELPVSQDTEDRSKQEILGDQNAGGQDK